MSDPVLAYESSNGVATMRLQRPERLNAIDSNLADALQAAWVRFEESDDRCAVLTGEGDRAFSAGADLHDPPAEFWRVVPGLASPVTKPIIAALHGHVVGGALIIVQHCDLAVASPSTRFSYPEAALGISGGMIASAVPRIPQKVAMELVVGGVIDVERAREVALINRIVQEGQHVDEATNWARHIAGLAPLVISHLKSFINESLPQSPPERHYRTKATLLHIAESDDAAEGMDAARCRRAPVFVGR